MSNELSDWFSQGFYLKHSKEGYNVFCVNIGNKKAKPKNTLLILHGFPESSFSFHKVVGGLHNRFERIVLFDFLGFGFSDKPRAGYGYSILDHADLAEDIWKQMNVSGGHLLAHDMGTSVATELNSRDIRKAKILKQGFNSISFTNGSMVIKYAKLRITQRLLLFSKLGPFISKLVNFQLFKHQIKSAHGNAQLESTDYSDLWAQVKYNNGHKISHLLIKYYLDRIKYENTRWLEDLGNTNTIINLIWGDDDQVARIEMAEYLKSEIIMTANFVRMKGLGHFGQLGSPEAWVQHVLSIEY